MIGLKGLPGIHGGVERHVEELGARLAAMGVRVTAYVRPRYTGSAGPHRGVERKLLPAIHTKHLDAATHSFFSALHAAFTGADVVHFHGIGPALFSPIPRLFGKTVVTTMHSRDYMRSKWGPAARFALRLGERVMLAASHRVIAVSREMADGLARPGRVEYIPNGVGDPVDPDDAAIAWAAGLGLAPREYLLFVGRISPEKGPLALIEAFAGVDTGVRLVLAGGTSHSADYARRVAEAAAKDARVVMTGALDAARLSALYRGARAFVLASEHEGLPVAMMEAASHGAPVIATDIPAAREIAARAGEAPLAFFAAGRDAPALGEALAKFLDEDASAPGERAARLRERVLAEYPWDAIAARTRAVYAEAMTNLPPEAARTPCPACGAIDKRVEYRRTRSGVVVRCVACGMVFSATPPPDEALPPAFTDDPEAYFENAKHRLGFARPYLSGTGKKRDGDGISLNPQSSILNPLLNPLLIDIGCFDGGFAGAARRLGFNVIGVEPVVQAAERARARHGLDVRVGTFETVDIPQADMVTFIHVFEHLKDPRASLARTREVLRDGGIVLIEIPAYDAWSRRVLGRRWRQFISDHDRFYTGEVLRRLVREEGFEILVERKVGKNLTPSLLADRVGRYYSRALGRAIRAVARAFGLSTRRFSLNLGDIRLVIARKV
ncbi:glycosyltransferase [bacterium]|nr:glycosyltransferase [bacterium]